MWSVEVSHSLILCYQMKERKSVILQGADYDNDTVCHENTIGYEVTSCS